MAYAGARMPKMAKRCFWVTPSSVSATSLQGQHTCERDAGRLATVAYCHMEQYPREVGRGQHYCGTWAQQSHM